MKLISRYIAKSQVALPLHCFVQGQRPMLLECILLSSSLCQSVKAKQSNPALAKKQNAIVGVLKDRPVMTLMAVDVIAKAADYRQTERDFLLGGFQEHNPILRPMLGHSSAIYAYGAAYAMGAAWVGHKMRTSRLSVVRKLWWLPQSYSIEQNIYGYVYTQGHYVR